ncbi:hypothetical protein GCM10011529_10690 [Polymorphobacter glacialis]|uniref:Uncharacterized protein n=1 Tax=Sandarakinorhabdus glacialis TaxID=1614636 RepID=A0A916ZP57_9SPHN|nr:hypothetical protein GCM10011529_10690 [Polymorphobacter glacialis]
MQDAAGTAGGATRAKRVEPVRRRGFAAFLLGLLGLCGLGGFAAGRVPARANSGGLAQFKPLRDITLLQLRISKRLTDELCDVSQSER